MEREPEEKHSDPGSKPEMDQDDKVDWQLELHFRSEEMESEAQTDDLVRGRVPLASFGVYLGP